MRVTFAVNREDITLKNRKTQRNPTGYIKIPAGKMDFFNLMLEETEHGNVIKVTLEVV